jgi:hypothetical protein
VNYSLQYNNLCHGFKPFDTSRRIESAHISSAAPFATTLHFFVTCDTPVWRGWQELCSGNKQGNGSD